MYGKTNAAAALLMLGSVTIGDAQTTSPWNPLVVSAVATHFAEPPRPTALFGKPVTISSLGNYFSVVGRFVGTITVFQDSIVAEFDTVFATRVHHGGKVLPTRVDSIRVGVGMRTQNSWIPVDHSEALQVERAMAIGSRVSLPRSRFVLPHVRGENDDDAWIVVTFHLTVGKPGDKDYHPDATTYAHSGRGILATPRPP